MKFKIRDKIRSKKHPELRGKIIHIINDKFSGKIYNKPLYRPDFGGWYLAEELELDKYFENDKDQE